MNKYKPSLPVVLVCKTEPVFVPPAAAYKFTLMPDTPFSAGKSCKPLSLTSFQIKSPIEPTGLSQVGAETSIESLQAPFVTIKRTFATVKGMLAIESPATAMAPWLLTKRQIALSAERPS